MINRRHLFYCEVGRVQWVISCCVCCDDVFVGRNFCFQTKYNIVVIVSAPHQLFLGLLPEEHGYTASPFDGRRDHVTKAGQSNEKQE